MSNPQQVPPQQRPSVRPGALSSSTGPVGAVGGSSVPVRPNLPATGAPRPAMRPPAQMNPRPISGGSAAQSIVQQQASVVGSARPTVQPSNPQIQNPGSNNAAAQQGSRAPFVPSMPHQGQTPSSPLRTSTGPVARPSSISQTQRPVNALPQQSGPQPAQNQQPGNQSARQPAPNQYQQLPGGSHVQQGNSAQNHQFSSPNAAQRQVAQAQLPRQPPIQQQSMGSPTSNLSPHSASLVQPQTSTTQSQGLQQRVGIPQSQPPASNFSSPVMHGYHNVPNPQSQLSQGQSQGSNPQSQFSQGQSQGSNPQAQFSQGQNQGSNPQAQFPPMQNQVPSPQSQFAQPQQRNSSSENINQDASAQFAGMALNQPVKSARAKRVYTGSTASSPANSANMPNSAMTPSIPQPGQQQMYSQPSLSQQGGIQSPQVYPQGQPGFQQGYPQPQPGVQQGFQQPQPGTQQGYPQFQHGAQQGFQQPQGYPAPHPGMQQNQQHPQNGVGMQPQGFNGQPAMGTQPQGFNIQPQGFQQPQMGAQGHRGSLKSQINPDLIPSPVDVQEVDQRLFNSVPYMTMSKSNPPLATTKFKAIDQGTLNLN